MSVLSEGENLSSTFPHEEGNFLFDANEFRT